MLEAEEEFFAPPPRAAPTPVPTAGVQVDVDAARALLLSGDKEGAMARFRSAVKRDPSHPAVQAFAAVLGATPAPTATRAAKDDVAAARALLAAGETEKANQKFLDLVEKDPSVALRVGDEVGRGKTNAAAARREGVRADMDVVLDAHQRVEYSSGPLRNLNLTWVLLGVMATVVGVAAILAFRWRG